MTATECAIATTPGPTIHDATEDGRSGHNRAMTDHELMDAVRRACIEAALAAYEDAGISGLCAEGRWEAAVGAIQSLDLERVAAEAGRGPAGAGR